jgi:hypothetical protein
MSFSQISQILDSAAATKKNDSALDDLLEQLRSACVDASVFRQYKIIDGDLSFDSESGPDVSFNFVCLLSSNFFIECLIRLSNAEVSAVVRMIHLRDGCGLASRDYGVFNLNGFEMSEEVAADPDSSFIDFMVCVAKAAVTVHLQLLESAGLPSSMAHQAAQLVIGPVDKF